jgi:FkbM family methyltransferase
MRPARRIYGLARSAVIYHGLPFRRRRLDRLYSRFVMAGSLCFDVGAHVGNRVASWRRLGARVVAVEPQRDCARVLGWMFASDPDVCVLRCAIGATPGTARLLVDPVNPTLTTVSDRWVQTLASSPRFKHLGLRFEPEDEVQLRTLDELIDEFGDPAFIKIDVEGSEEQALRGLSRAAQAMSFEYMPETKDSTIECIQRLEVLGRYEFNRSTGETHELAEPSWLDADGIGEFIDALPANADSGDIYARLLGR